jgi:hypothetical protein
VKLTAQAAAEWVFVGWTGDIESTEESVQILIGEPKEVTATFEKKKYPLTVNIEGEGEVLEEIVNAGRTTDYNSGTTVKLTAQPEDEWLFTGWSGDIGDINTTENPIQLNIIESKTITATFEKKKYPLTVNIEGEGEVLEEIVNAGRTTDYNSGTTVKLTAVPSEGWRFSGWTGAIQSSELEVQLLVSEAKEVNAEFRELEMKSISVLNPIDTLVISRKHKFQISGTYTNGNSIDLTDLATIDLIDEKITLLENNEFTAGKSGQTSIKISYNNLEIIEDLYIEFYEEVLDETNTYLKEKNKSSTINVPIVIINFIPTSDGIEISPEYKPEGTGLIKWYYNSYHNINENWCKNNQTDSLCKVGSVEMYKIRANEINNFVKFGIEEGSKFRNFNQINSSQSITVETIKYFNVYELKTKNYGRGGNEANTPSPDYEWLFNIINLEELVNNLGVKEVWMSNPSPEFNYPESNMSSPITGDVSNSYRIQNDLPIYNKTYKVFGINLDRGPAEALHCRGHQIEAQFHHIEKDKKFGEQLFWNKFVGIDESRKPIGRSGATHFPPNSKIDYDYCNETLVESDIKNWSPQGGETDLVSCDTWTGIQYDYPFETIFWNKTKGIDNIALDSSYKWFIYWFQSIPGENNNIPYLRGGEEFTLTNWWDLFYNWDEAITDNRTLWE